MPYAPYETGTPQYDVHAYGGYRAQTRPDGTPIAGTSAADQDVSRWREMGGQPARGAQIDTANSDASRTYQMSGLGMQQGAMNDTRDAMGLARSAAMGEAPSAAEIYGHKMIDDSIASQMAMANSAHGGPAAVAAAQRQAAFQGAQTQQSGARDIAAMRAQEMAGAREQYLGGAGQLGSQASAYTGAAGGIRGQDFQQAYGQAGFDDAALARQQQNQQYYEGLGQQTRMGELGNATQQYGVGANYELGHRQNQQAEDNSTWGKVKDIVGGVGGVVGGIVSDERAKMPLSGGPVLGFLLPKGGAYLPRPSEEAPETSWLEPDKFAGRKAGSAPADTSQMAPGTEDWNRYGGGEKYGAPSGSPSAGSIALGSLGAIGKGLMHFSDERTKLPFGESAGLSFLNGGSGVGGGAELGPGGGITHGDLLRAGSGMGDPNMMHGMVGGGGITGGMSMGGHAIPSDRNTKYMLSDARAKEAAFESGKKEGRAEFVDDILAPLSGDEPSFIANKSPAVRAAYANFLPPTGKLINAVAELRGTPSEKAPAAPARPTPDMGGIDRDQQYFSKPAARGGPDMFDRDAQYMDPVAQANRSQVGSLYTYKPGFAEASGQQTGEPNMGPMAQNMAADPLASTAVKKDPQSGMLVLDDDKLQKLQSAGIASLQQQIDQLANSGRYLGKRGR